MSGGDARPIRQAQGRLYANALLPQHLLGRIVMVRLRSIRAKLPFTSHLIESEWQHLELVLCEQRICAVPEELVRHPLVPLVGISPALSYREVWPSLYRSAHAQLTERHCAWFLSATPVSPPPCSSVHSRRAAVSLSLSRQRWWIESVCVGATAVRHAVRF